MVMPPASVTIRRLPLRRRLRETAIAGAFLAPATIVLALFWMWPTLFALVISTTRYGLGGMGEFVGLRNYAVTLRDEDFLRSLMNTVNFLIYSVPASLGISLLIAVLLNAKIRMLGLFRTVYFLPYITSQVAVAVVWLFIFSQQPFGLANYLLSFLGVKPVNWLNEARGIWEIALGALLGQERFRIAPGIGADDPLLFPLVLLARGPSVALCSIIIMTVWRSIGYSMVIFLAGLQGIDRTYYEAAEIDGATAWQKFWRVTWPLVSPYTFFLAIITTIFAFKEFVPVYIMTPQGGLDYDTATVVFYLFELAFTGQARFGRAAAVGFLLFLILTVISIVQKVVIGGRVHYE